jgi:glyoxylase-like metal-dependent hydrolase (beta-lactamase superfamily II)
MGQVLDLAERAWNGELEGTQVHPGMALVAFEELAPKLGFMSAFSNVAVFDSGDGLVFLDTSSFFHAAIVHKQVRAWSDAPVHTAVYTHGHVDHVFGLAPFESEASSKGHAPIRVLAHHACPERFDRYKLTSGYNGVINQRQFGLPQPIFPTSFRYPDETVGDGYKLEVGDLHFEIHHDRGETDDHLWIWEPTSRAIYTGDLFIWASPNCGNPQKAQRYPLEWARALRRMQEREADLLLPGHGPPIVGRERVQQALEETALLLESLVEQTLQMMNAGARLDDVVQSIVIDEELLQRPYLRPSYDDPRFIVRNLWRLYGGWYDGNPARLSPPADRVLASEVAALAGGVRTLIERAKALAADREFELASQLAEWAAQASPKDLKVRDARAEIYKARMETVPSLMAKAIYRDAAKSS